jgi:hypothetical protein
MVPLLQLGAAAALPSDEFSTKLEAGFEGKEQTSFSGVQHVNRCQTDAIGNWQSPTTNRPIISRTNPAAAQRDRATRITRTRDPAGKKRKAAKARRSWQRVPINCQVDYVCDGRTRPGSQIDLMSKRSRATWTPNDQMYTDARLLFKWLAGLLSDADDAAQKKPEI